MRIACNHGTFEKAPPSFQKDPLALTEPTRLHSTSAKKGPCPVCLNNHSISQQISSATQDICKACAERLCGEFLPEYTTGQAMCDSSSSKECQYCERSFKPRSVISTSSDSQFDRLSYEDLRNQRSTKLETVANDIQEHVSLSNW